MQDAGLRTVSLPLCTWGFATRAIPSAAKIHPCLYDDGVKKMRTAVSLRPTAASQVI